MSCSAELNWLKDKYRNPAAIDAMPEGDRGQRSILLDFYRHLIFQNVNLSDKDKLAFKIARGGELCMLIRGGVQETQFNCQ